MMEASEVQAIFQTKIINDLEECYRTIVHGEMYDPLSPGLTLLALLTGVISRIEGDEIQLKMIDFLKRLNVEVFDWENDPIPDPE